MTDTDKILFSIRAIKILEFNYKNALAFEGNVDPSGLPIQAKFKINYRWNIELELFAVVIDFIYLLNVNGVQDEILKLSYITEYKVDNLKDVFTVRSKDDFDMDVLLESTLVGIAISTGRGILLVKTQGTILENRILPPISPKDFLLSKKSKTP